MSGTIAHIACSHLQYTQVPIMKSPTTATLEFLT